MKKMLIAGLMALAAAGAVRAEVKLAEVFPAGITPDAAVIEAVAPDVKDAQLVYVYDFRKPLIDGKRADYLTDKSAEVKPFKTVGYLVYLVGKDGQAKYVYTTMDAFSDSAAKVGVPTVDSGAIFQQPVKNLTVKSNVDGVKNGAFAEGNIEFWPYNYSQKNAKNVAGARDDQFDFGDEMQNGGNHGSMQVHNTAEQATVFGYSDWKNAPNVDLGIGTNTKGQPDWTFCRNANNDYQTTLLFVFVQ